MDFPAPVAPTRAVVPRKVRSTSRTVRTGSSSGVAYPKVTSIAGVPLTSRSPSRSVGCSRNRSPIRSRLTFACWNWSKTWESCWIGLKNWVR